MATENKRQQSISSLAQFPPELLEIIFSFLVRSSTDIHNVRLVCRTFDNACETCFGQTFDNKIFHLSQRSLDTLSALTDRNAGKYIKRFRLRPVAFAERGLPELRQCNMLRSIDTQMEALFKIRSAVKQDEHLEDLPVQVLEKMVNLDEIVVTDPGMQDVQYEPYRGARWPGLEMTYRETLNLEPNGTWERTYDSHVVSRTLALIVAAMMKSPRVRERIRSFSFQPSVDYTELPKGTFGIGSGEALWPNLLTLKLRLSNPPSHVLRLKTIEMLVRHLPDFLAGMQNSLRNLSIAFPDYEELPIYPHFENTLYGNEGLEALTQLHFPNLHTINFENVHPRSSGVRYLKTFLKKHASTLQKLTLIDLSMPPPSWRRFVEFLGNELELMLFSTWTTERSRGLPRLPKEFEIPKHVWKSTAKDVRMNPEEIGRSDSFGLI